MESENTIKEIKLELPELNIKETSDKQVKVETNDKNVALFLSAIAIFSFVYDVFVSDVKTCLNQTQTLRNKILIVLITFFHHFLAIFGLFGWMFNNKKLLLAYIIIIIVTIVQWKFNSGHCIITRSVAKLSGNDDYKRFNDLYRIIGLKKLIPSRWLYYTSFSIFIAISLYKIYFT